MASPRIFVSSTCYDLSEIRDSLYSFIESLNYIPIFSDKNDVFYHPDLHTHESCLKEIENCQLFILIVGGRFGGHYNLDTEKSIVNAEYSAAKHLKMPIFTFIKREVYEDHRQFTQNKIHKPSLYKDFHYSAIEKQEHAVNIFNFIDIVRKNEINNAIFSFEYGREIKQILLKQFSGLFYDFLWQRQKNIEYQKNENLLNDLTILGKKTEEIIENIYKKVDEANATQNLSKIESESDARRFWINMIRIFGVSLNNNPDKNKILLDLKENETWTEYLLRTGRFRIFNQKLNDSRTAKILIHDGTKKYLCLAIIIGKMTERETETVKKLNKYFSALKKIPREKRIEIFTELT